HRGNREKSDRKHRDDHRQALIDCKMTHRLAPSSPRLNTGSNTTLIECYRGVAQAPTDRFPERFWSTAHRCVRNPCDYGPGAAAMKTANTMRSGRSMCGVVIWVAN